MAERSVCKGVPVAMGGWVLADKHDLAYVGSTQVAHTCACTRKCAHTEAIQRKTLAHIALTPWPKGSHLYPTSAHSHITNTVGVGYFNMLAKAMSHHASTLPASCQRHASTMPAPWHSMPFLPSHWYSMQTSTRGYQLRT